MNIDWSSVLIVIVCVASLVATVWIDEKVKEWKKQSSSAFPLFKLTDEEGDILVSAYNSEWLFSPLCWKVDNEDLKVKIRKSLKGCGFLTTWIMEYRPKFAESEIYGEYSMIALRKQWIVALLEYNNMQEKLK